MLVKEIMLTNFVTLSPKTTFFEAAKIFLKSHISGAPVVDDNGNLVGILSEKDLFRGLYPSYEKYYTDPDYYLSEEGLQEAVEESRNKLVEDVMSKRIITATPETPILKIGGLMVASGIHRIPVLDKNNKVIGMVTRGDTYRTILQEKFNLYTVA